MQDVTGVSCPVHGFYVAYLFPEQINFGPAVDHLLSRPTPYISSVFTLLLLTYLDTDLRKTIPGTQYVLKKH